MIKFGKTEKKKNTVREVALKNNNKQTNKYFSLLPFFLLSFSKQNQYQKINFKFSCQPFHPLHLSINTLI